MTDSEPTSEPSSFNVVLGRRDRSVDETLLQEMKDGIVHFLTHPFVVVHSLDLEERVRVPEGLPGFPNLHVQISYTPLEIDAYRLRTELHQLGDDGSRRSHQKVPITVLGRMACTPHGGHVREDFYLVVASSHRTGNNEYTYRIARCDVRDYAASEAGEVR